MNTVKRKKSPYRGRGVVFDGVNTIQSARFPIKMRDRPREEFPYTTVPGDTLPRLAATFLGSTLNWWFIQDRNEIDYPLCIAPGTRLIIPSITSANIEVRKLDR